MIRKLSLGCVMLFVALIISGCAQVIADAIYKDKYAKPATISRQINASSGKAAVNAAVLAAGKTGWTPKTISVETGYVLAEAVADAKYTRGARDYTYRLEVRVPESGKGETNVVVTPPTGVVSSKSTEQLANEFLDALTTELVSKAK